MSSDTQGEVVDHEESITVCETDQAVDEVVSTEPLSTEPPLLSTPTTTVEPQSPTQTQRFKKQYEEEIQKCSPSPPISPSRILPGTGLSELSKQLRILQAKNQAQSIEIDRLERQLRILAELQGISVAELRNALQQACEAEAHGELQHRVASLRAELEAATLLHANRQQQLQRSGPDPASAKRIANLELRIGELEEMEQKQKADMQDLYAQLAQEKENATRMGTLYEQLKNEREREQQHNQQQLKSTINDDSQQSNEKQNDFLAQQEALLERAKNAEMETQILEEKFALSEQQRDTMQEHARLREAQFKARFLVQEENIQDLEQQLSSLYAAYTLLQEEQEAEEQTRSLLLTNLNLANEQVARDVDSQILQQSASPSVMLPDSYAWQEQQNPDLQTGVPIISGMLLVRGNGIIKTWKKNRVSIVPSSHRNVFLKVGTDARYLLDIDVAKVEPHHKQSFGFAILTNPGNSRADVIYVAATSQKQYDKWMGKLFQILAGASPVSNEQEITTSDYNIDVLAQESTDLERALELSKHDL